MEDKQEAVPTRNEGVALFAWEQDLRDTHRIPPDLAGIWLYLRSSLRGWVGMSDRLRTLMTGWVAEIEAQGSLRPAPEGHRCEKIIRAGMAWRCNLAVGHGGECISIDGYAGPGVEICPNDGAPLRPTGGNSLDCPKCGYLKDLDEV